MFRVVNLKAAIFFPYQNYVSNLNEVQKLDLFHKKNVYAPGGR